MFMPVDMRGVILKRERLEDLRGSSLKVAMVWRIGVAGGVELG